MVYTTVFVASWNFSQSLWPFLFRTTMCQSLNFVWLPCLISHGFPRLGWLPFFPFVALVFRLTRDYVFNHPCTFFIARWLLSSSFDLLNLDSDAPWVSSSWLLLFKASVFVVSFFFFLLHDLFLCTSQLVLQRFPRTLSNLATHLVSPPPGFIFPPPFCCSLVSLCCQHTDTSTTFTE
jgi:hypothetical protein